MALELTQTMTVEEYLHLDETDAENHYEYVDGQVYLMAGGTFNHSTISGNYLQRSSKSPTRKTMSCIQF